MTTGLHPEFIPSFYARFPMPMITDWAMDKALENGFFRNGADFCSIHARYLGNKWASCVMLRLPIQDFEFKKRHRKLLKHNSQRFKVEVGPFVHNEEKEALWQRYKTTVHQWGNVSQLEFHLLRGKPATSYRMHELCVYDQGKLVAFSVFDVGEKTLASLEAAYDPDYASYSLGFYTMLLEIQYCQAQGYSHYYPGFLPKDTPMFNYKLRPGGMEFFQLRSKTWVAYELLSEGDWLMDELMDKLGLLKQILAGNGINGIEGYSMGIAFASQKPQIDNYNIHLIVPLTIVNTTRLLFITWNAVTRNYFLFEGFNLSPALAVDTPKPVHHYLSVQQRSFVGQFQRAGDVLTLINRLLL
ncbi:MAG: GNAT family N-acetyltransferase [Saprospiraceae bacterium]|nr:GNAT family N-acetyltransferase [Saprospiraceae bacterium]